LKNRLCSRNELNQPYQSLRARLTEAAKPILGSLTLPEPDLAHETNLSPENPGEPKTLMPEEMNGLQGTPTFQNEAVAAPGGRFS